MTSPEDLIHSFEHFNISTVDRNIGSWIRQFSNSSKKDWYNSENSLMRVLLDLALIEPNSVEIPTGDSFEKVANTLARAIGNCDREADYSTDYLATLAALSFAAAGNFPSAGVFAKKAKENKNPGPAEKWMMEILSSPEFALKDSNPPSVFAVYSILMDEALQSGQSADFDQARQELDNACLKALDEVARTDKFLLLLWKQIHRRFEQLSTPRVLKEIGFQNQAFISALTEETLMLYPSQVHTLRSYALTKPGSPIFVSLPTSTGKSLLGEISLVASLSWDRSRWLAVYLAPYRALTDQLQKRMRKRLRKIGITCIIRRGGYLSDQTSIDEGRPTVLIATPESFDALLRIRPQLYHQLSACVFDEFHLIEQQQRGLRYEGILGRFLSGASGEKWPKIVALSAVVQDTEKVTQWLQTSENNVSRLSWIPTSRRLAIVGPTGETQYFCPGEGVNNENDDEVIWKGNIKLNHYVSTYPIIPTEKEKILENIAAVALDQWRRFNKPILVLASSRNHARLIAKLVSNMLPVDANTKSAFLANEISHRFPYLYTLQECLKRDVAYHNASLPDWVRSELEDLMKGRELKIVVATTTLAEGVDLPFRVVVLAHWKQWSFGKFRAMPSLLFRNIAGRCGRAWEYAEGDTLIVDSPDKELIEYVKRYNVYIDTYVKPLRYGLHSSLERENQTQEQENETQKIITPESQAVLESQYIAYIAACEKVENTEERFTSSLYASMDENTKKQVRAHINQFTENMLLEPEFPVLQRNSPLQLSSFGEIALKTGLSPKSGVSLAKFLKIYAATKESKKGRKNRNSYRISWEPIVDVLWKQQLLIQEIQNPQIGNRGFSIKDDNFIFVTMAWISGIPVEVIAYLIFTGQSQQKNLILAWLTGDNDTLPSLFEEDIDQVAVFCKQHLAEQWSWILRGAATIAENLTETQIQSDTLNHLALRFQYGVKNLATVRFLQHGNCPIDRAKIDWLIDSFKLFNTLNDGIEIPQFIKWLQQNQESVPIRIFSDFPRIAVTKDDIEELIGFLERIEQEEVNDQ